MKNFFITGLPRSRTTWLANLLTWGRSFCFHDLLGEGPSVEKMSANFLIAAESAELEYLGDADSALAPLVKEIDAAFPNAKWVLVERNIKEAFESYRSYFSLLPYPGTEHLSSQQIAQAFVQCQKWCDDVKTVIPKERLLVLRFDELDSFPEIERLWFWCLPDQPFPGERCRMLQNFEINPCRRKIARLPNMLPEWRKKLT